jgi:hypothetical protein
MTTGRATTTERCARCGEAFEPGFTVCWRCGTGIDGTPPAAGFLPDSAPPLPDCAPARELACLRCSTPMAIVGRMRFHEGTRAWPFLFGELGELFVNRESFDTYACTRCGKVEFYIAP